MFTRKSNPVESKKCQHLQWAQPGRQICTHTALSPCWLGMPPLPRSNALSQITSRPTTDVTDAVSSCPDFCLQVRNPNSTAMCFWPGPEGRSLTSQTPSAPSAVTGKTKTKGPALQALTSQNFQTIGQQN
ncbi:hypothetical protein SEA_POPPER_38 [Arthrobacter phage Popper]|uniref:Uncharacterized protein n=1 Tax=Arthrobacter phage Popper TaxID=2859633 RepID=A0AAE7WDC6_9CAUD|nr:hypothetical protein QEO78_gp68 [Arthrobacter phage Popper]QYC54988.1 hypothetical protein SEA_POPPER_38 [Arthrobacter phage Popper]